MNPAPGHRILTWRRLLVAAAAGLLVVSLGQAIGRDDREALVGLEWTSRADRTRLSASRAGVLTGLGRRG